MGLTRRLLAIAATLWIAAGVVLGGIPQYDRRQYDRTPLTDEQRQGIAKGYLIAFYLIPGTSPPPFPNPDDTEGCAYRATVADREACFARYGSRWEIDGIPDRNPDPGQLQHGGTKETPAGQSIDPNLRAFGATQGLPNPAGSLGGEGIAVSSTGRNGFVANGESNQVSAFSFDLETGAPTPAPGSPYAVGEFPSAVTIDATGRFLYVAGDFGVSAFSIDPQTSALTPIRTLPAHGRPQAIAASGHSLLVDVFDLDTLDTTIRMYALDANTGEPTDVFDLAVPVHFPGTMAMTPEGRFLYVPTSTNLLGYYINDLEGRLDPLPGVSYAASGGRLAMHPRLPFLYLDTFGSPDDMLQAIRYDPYTGALTPIGQPVPTESDTEGLVVHPTGDALYAATPNTRTVSSFAIDRTTGLLTRLGDPVPISAGGSALQVRFTPRTGLAGVGVPYSQTLDARAGTPPFSFGIDQGSLPAGLSLDPKAGVISGTPTSKAVSSFRVRAVNNLGDVAFQNYAIQSIDPPAAPAAPAALTVTALSSTQIELAWQDNAQGTGSFQVEINLDGSFYRKVEEFVPSTTSAVIDGFSPASKYDFRVRAVNPGGASAYSETATVTTPAASPAACVASATARCLGGGRFKVEAFYQAPDQRFGGAHVEQLTDDTAYLWFLSQTNVETVVKVLNACSIGGHYWVFAGGLTNLAVAIRVTDTLTGAIREFENPMNAAFVPIQDTGAFGTCNASPASIGEEETVSASVAPPPSGEAANWRLPTGSSTCTPGDTALCLDGARFRVEATFQTSDGRSGSAHMAQITPDTGYMWFFDEGNVEAVVKVLDACGVNGHQWVFAGGLTNVDVQITVTDTVTDDVRHYHNPQGTPFQPVQDTSAFSCP